MPDHRFNLPVLATRVLRAAVFFFVLKGRVRSAVGKVVTWAKAKLTDSFRPLPIITGLVGDALRSRQELVAENMMLRQQLIVASRKVKQPRFRPHERGLLVFPLCPDIHRVAIVA